MTPKENFRLGFLMRCAEEGCTPVEIQERVKLAVGPIVPAAAGALGKLWASLPAYDTLKAIGSFPFQVTGASLAASGVLGAAGGYGLAKMQSSDVDPDEAKRQELIAAYHLQAELARRRASQKTYRQAVPALPQFH